MPDSTDSSSPTALESVLSEKQSLVSREEQARLWREGLFWALISPLFLGATPIFAKLAYAAGADVLTVVAFRTIFAALMMWTAVFLFARRFIRSSTPGILSSLLVGAINGIGSLFYYASLNRIDASVGQLLNVSYLVFVTILLRLIGHSISRLTIFRTLLVIGAVYLLTVGSLNVPDWVGVVMMLTAAFTYAVHLVLSQRIMYDIPAATMTLYAITAMAVVVTIPWLFGAMPLTAVSETAWQAILLMGLVTALSRLTLFLGVKRLGSLQSALLNVLEVVVSIVLAIIFLGERLTAVQWLGAIILLISILLVRYERGIPKYVDWWQFLWRRRLPR
jgi:drug/metabolite transporter (DMT)-like permease